MRHRFLKVSLGFALAVLLAQGAQAGLISSIAKIAKKVDAPSTSINKLPDGSLQYLDLNLANGAPPNLLRSKLNADNEWVLRDSSGKIVDDLGQVSNPALIIDNAHLPQDLNKLTTLPGGAPILIRSNDHVFKLERQPGWVLKAGGAGIRVSDTSRLKRALTYFEMPWANGPVRILGLKDQAADSMSLRRGVDINALQNSPEQFRGQTIAMAGPIINNRISVAGNKLSISELRATAEQYDISLIVLESESRVAPKALLRQLDGDQAGGVPQNTGQFLAKLQQPGSDTVFEISPTGKQQVVIRQQTPAVDAAPALSNLQSAIIAATVVRSVAKVSIYRPDEARTRELDDRLVWWLPSWAFVYLVVSAVLGLLVIGTTMDAFYFFWPRSGTGNDLIRYTEMGVSLLVMLLVFLPIFGLPVAIYKVLMLIYQAIRWLFHLVFGLALLIVKPFRSEQ